MNNFRELVVWQKSVALVTEIYKGTKLFPDNEKFNLVTQMQRAATSIASNIAEGSGRNSSAMFKQFLTISLGSAYELETQIIISNKLFYINDEYCSELIKSVQEIQKMIYGLYNSI